MLISSLLSSYIFILDGHDSVQDAAAALELAFLKVRPFICTYYVYAVFIIIII